MDRKRREKAAPAAYYTLQLPCGLLVLCRRPSAVTAVGTKLHGMMDATGPAGVDGVQLS